MNVLGSRDFVRTFRHAHLFSGIGAGAKGFNLASPRVGNLVGEFECAGGIDVDRGAIANFERMTGVKGTVLDLFDRPQYESFWGKEPPPGWREALPSDLLVAFGRQTPDVAFTSAPCKGFSGLLSTTKSKTDKYQALNRLTLRGMWLLLEAYRDDPVPIILFENVPRIQTRGRPLLDEIMQLLRSYGYIVNEDVHDCGELGGLAQTRKRFLLIARHPVKIPPFVYQPPKHRLRGVGEVIGKLPLPGDPVGGVHHRVPALQWQTWVRLAFVEAGKDWRSLNKLRVEDGVLQDYGLVPEGAGGEPMRHHSLGVCRWTDTAPVIVGNHRSPYQGRYSVADPRIETDREGSGRLGVRCWEETAGTVTGCSRVENGAFSIADPRPGVYLHHGALGVRGFDQAAGVVAGASRPMNGPHAVADPRPTQANQTFAQYGVIDWAENAGAVTGQSTPGGGPFSVADPRVDGHDRSVMLGVRAWGMTAPCVKGDMSVGTGPYAIADIRMTGGSRFNNNYRVIRYADASSAVAGPGGPGGLAVADPRAPESPLFKKNKYKVTAMDAAAGSVIAASTTGDGAFAVADPRPGKASEALQGNWRIENWGEASRAVVAGRKSGAAAVADPRGGEDPDRLHGKYRVECWIGPSRAVIAGRDQGAFAVADPRPNWGTGRHEAIMRVTAHDAPVGTIPANAHSVTGGQPCVADVRREHYQTGGHYGVLRWGEAALTVSASACHDNSFNSVADPRDVDLGGAERPALPAPTQKLVCRIVAEDGTWHRPFTTLELGSLQSLFDPEEAFFQDPATGLWQAREGFELTGVDGGNVSDASVREWIGNAVPSEAARAMATTIGETLLLAGAGEGFTLSTREIWVKPLGLALAVDSRQPAFDMDRGLA